LPAATIPLDRGHKKKYRGYRSLSFSTQQKEAKEKTSEQEKLRPPRKQRSLEFGDKPLTREEQKEDKTKIASAMQSKSDERKPRKAQFASARTSELRLFRKNAK